MRYTECKKASKVTDRSQAIGEFLEWLQHEKGIVFAKWGTEKYETETLFMTHLSTEKLLAEFFGIDLDKLEKEKRHMLEEQRKLNEQSNRRSENKAESTS